MTLIINVTTPDGIVMASDSRQTQRNNKQITRISTNSAYKLFEVDNRIIIGTAGLAFFADKTGIQKNVSTYIKDYCNKTDLENLTVEDIAVGIHEYTNDNYPWEQQLDMSAQQLKMDAERNGAEVLSIEKINDSVEFRIKQPSGKIEKGHLNIEPVNLLISGYNKDGTSETYEIRFPGRIDKKRGNNEYGSTWVGQGDLVSRMILGYDGKMLNLPLFQKTLSTVPQEEVLRQLRGIEYNIPWGLLTLQDGVDIAVFLIKATSMIQRYADGVNMDNGDIQGVGGPIDVATITKENGIQWVKQKQITYPEF
ncbi:hypothetical protein OTK55_03045 [Methanosphaera sp. Vir-13MRS]|jgi:hypothetical protein|uniref:hypothetical protein n=1 Tax=Candidatus Methanosphaera massiliense TaxID=3017187 RepID=UPI0023803797|nr:hypothetical protein [Candidatus Methanosphaera massiliense]MDE4077995.1 hypothetical protein [Candidatus Methanosphaera massiliense]MDY2745340.1 hypothetical protein [Methanosphaera sp.]